MTARTLLSPTAIASALLLIIGGAALFGSLDMGIGTPDVPDAGFFPLLASVVLVALSVVLLVGEFRRAPSGEEAPKGETLASMVPALSAMAGLILYIPALEWLGFLIATALLVAVLLAVFGLRNILAYVAAIPLIAGGSYLLFHFLLDLPLPVGPLGF